ncbi:MAG TPA: hypothetical protein VE990_20260 [Acidimicrobiales bacterium]|nr:hypothetical protein [Acidimicrobiales bacterium]
MADAGRRLTALETSFNSQSATLASSDIQSNYLKPAVDLLAQAQAFAPGPDQSSLEQLQTLVNRVRYVIDTFTLAYNSRAAWERYQAQQT